MNKSSLWGQCGLKGIRMNILLVSHGQLCQGMNDAFHMFSPTATCVHAVSLTNEGGVDAFRAELSAKLEELLAEGDVLICADLKGGTPYNESYAQFLTNPEHIRLAAGMNLPMLVESGALASFGGGLEAVYQAALTAGADGVTGTDLPEDSSDDEEEDLF